MFVGHELSLAKVVTKSLQHRQDRMGLRVLALCGFTQNAHIYSKQVCPMSTQPPSFLTGTAAWRDPEDMQRGRIWSLPTSLYQPWRLILVRTVFLEPPHIVEKVDMPWAQNTSEFDSDATTEKEEQTPETTPRAWWLSTNDRTAYRSGLIARWSFASKLMHDQSLTRRYGISTVSW